jgi:hypothetical protein
MNLGYNLSEDLISAYIILLNIAYMKSKSI